VVHDRSTQPPPGSRENRSYVQSVADSRPRRWCALSLLRLLSQHSVEEDFPAAVYVPRLILIGHDGHQEHVVSPLFSSVHFVRPRFANFRRALIDRWIAGCSLLLLLSLYCSVFLGSEGSSVPQLLRSACFQASACREAFGDDFHEKPSRYARFALVAPDLRSSARMSRN